MAETFSAIWQVSAFVSKKTKQRYMKVRIRLSYRVLALVLGTVSVVIFFAARIINNQFRSSIIETMEKRDAALLEDISTTFSNIADCEYKKLITLKSVIESTLKNNYAENESFYRSIVKNNCNGNQMLATVWICFDNGYVSGVSNGRHLLRTENSSYGLESKNSFIDYDTDNNTESPFYVVRRLGKAIFSEPATFYQDESVTKKYLKSSIALPINENGNTVGVISSDINLNSLRLLVDSICVANNKKVTIVSSGGMIVNYFNPDFIGLQFADIDTVIAKADTSDTRSFMIKDHSGNDSILCTTLTINPAGLDNQWKLIATTSVAEVNEQIGSSLMFVKKVIVVGLLLLAIIIFILSMKIVAPINKVNAIIRKLSLGQVDNALKMDVDSNDELGQMADSSNKVVDGLLQVTKFAENIGNGNSNYNFTPLSENDVLGNAIIEMKNSLDRAKEEENQRRDEEGQLNWASNGINLFNKVLRVDNSDMKTLASEIIKTLTLYLDSQMGAFYIIPSDRKGAELVAHIGFGKDKAAANGFVEPGRGLIGRAYLEKETIFISDITPDIDQIGSGLGHALPKSALIVPLLYNKDLTGIIEIYSFKVLQPYQISFVEKLAENIASTISTVKINGQTAQLLEKSKRQAETLEQQEEEIRQNMEEMQATQEESTQKEEELTTIISGFNSVMPTVHYDTSQRITNVNDEFAALVNTKKEKLIGKRHKSEVIMDENEQTQHERFWQELLKGNIMETEELFVSGKKQVWLLERFIPVTDTDGTITEIMAIGIDITSQKKIEEKIQMIQEGVIPDDLKKEITPETSTKVQIIDLTNLNVVYKNDEKKIADILKRYQEQIPAQISEMENLIKDRNYKSLKTVAKSLKTKINYLGIKHIYNSIDTIIKLIDDDKNLTAIPGLFKSMKTLWNAASAELSDIVNNKTNL